MGRSDDHTLPEVGSTNMRLEFRSILLVLQRVEKLGIGTDGESTA